MEVTHHHHHRAAATPPPVMTPEEFAQAYQKGRTKTVRFLVSRGVGLDTAEEIAQDAWGKGWMQRAELLNFSSIGPWINTIALNIFRARIRRQPVDCEVPEQQVQPTATPEAVHVSLVLQGCDAEERFLIEATAAGYTSLDLAQLEGCPPSTIRVRLMRLRRRLTPHFATERALRSAKRH